MLFLIKTWPRVSACSAADIFFCKTYFALRLHDIALIVFLSCGYFAGVAVFLVSAVRACRPERFVAMVVSIAKAMEAIEDFDNDLPPLPGQ